MITHSSRPKVLLLPFALGLLALVLLGCTGGGEREARVAEATETPAPTPTPVREFPEPRYDSIFIPRTEAQEAAGVAAGASVSDRPGVLIVGYSNTFRAFRRFDTYFRPEFVLVNGAQRGREADDWAQTEEPWLELHEVLDADPALAELAPTPDEAIEVVLIQQTLAGTAEPRVELFRSSLNAMIDRLADEFPNLAQVYLIGRDYGGWAADVADDGTPFAGEPGNWSSSIAIDLVIEDNADRPDGVWVGAGPYLWANGDTPRADGLSWPRAGYVDDGRHYNLESAVKVLDLVDQFFSEDATSPWYRREALTPLASES